MACPNPFRFPTAQESRSISDLREIQAEVCSLQMAILDAREMGLRSTTVCDSNMATDTDHWQTWINGISASCDSVERTMLDRQESVICYFEGLGYSISRVTNEITGNTFCWVIRW
jgi:hypothetical protein